MKKMAFRPTKQWVKEHSHKPSNCIHPDVLCYPIIDHFNHHGQGFCVGISIEENDLDIIRFCDRTYNPETKMDNISSRQWHPNEAQLVATYLSLAVINAWGLLPEYRSQLGVMGRKRTRDMRGRT